MEPCERPRLLSMIGSLLDVSDRYQRAALNDDVHNERVRDEHDRLLTAARAGGRRGRGTRRRRPRDGRGRARDGDLRRARDVRLLVGLA
jgi:hypothetical protein